MVMPTQQTVLLVGGTGRTGQRVMRQLLDRGIGVRAIVRSKQKLPPHVAGNPNLALIEASLLSLGDDELQQHLRGCEAVISCLGHVINLRGLFGPPRDLVTQATKRLCRAVEAIAPPAPTRFVLMSSVSVNRPGRLDTRRGTFERAFIALLRSLLPPAMDNQRAADFLCREIGTEHPFVQWSVVRPDALLEGDISEYTVHAGLVSAVFRPDSTQIANVAHFMCELVANPKTWATWQGKFPVITNTEGPAR